MSDVFISYARSTAVQAHAVAEAGEAKALGIPGVLLFGIPLLTKKVGLLNSLGCWAESTGKIFHWLQRVI